MPDTLLGSRLLRRVARRARREVLGLRRVTVRAGDPGAVRVSRMRGVRARSYRLADSAAGYAVRGGRLRVLLPDATALVQLASSGLLNGEVHRLRVRLASSPAWLVIGIRPPRLGRTAVGFRWRRRGSTLTVELRWSRPYPVHRALADVLAAVLRARPWDQVSGPVYALERTGWLAGGSSWPQGQFTAGAPDAVPDELGRPLGPFLPADGSPGDPPLVTAVANPYGRRLAGAAARYQLVAGPEQPALREEGGRVVLRLDRRTSAEAAVARAAMSKYAVVRVDSAIPADPYVVTALRALAACGMVFAAPDAAVRSALSALGLVAVGDAKEVEDLRGYALSVEAARRAALAGDAALSRTALGGSGTMPLPAVSVLLSSMRPDHVETCLDYLAGQTYPALEVLVGLHGYEVAEPIRQRWQDRLPFPVRIRSFPAGLTFGEVLGQLSRIAEGELVAKVDDDDHYGAHHVTDLVIAWHTSGAEVAAKGSRFVHLPETGETIDRTWTAPEVLDATPAGGTLLLARSTLTQVGGWSHSSRHVDTDLLIRVKAAGGLVYRTHALEYVYVRRTAGHTWHTEIEELVAQGERVYKGLPEQIIRPDYSAGG